MSTLCFSTYIYFNKIYTKEANSALSDSIVKSVINEKDIKYHVCFHPFFSTQSRSSCITVLTVVLLKIPLLKFQNNLL